jgi:hypothetical protein
MMKNKLLIMLFTGAYFDAVVRLLMQMTNGQDIGREKMFNAKNNPFSTELEIAFYDSIKSSDEGFLKISNEIKKGNALLKLGRKLNL